MRSKISKIPDEVLRNIFPKKFKRSLASEWVYSELKRMILSGKLRKGKRLVRDEIAQNFNVSGKNVAEAFSQLKKDRLIIIKWGKGSFVASNGLRKFKKKLQIET
jgi:DNA-binding GntR family transcriptional regulator